MIIGIYKNKNVDALSYICYTYNKKLLISSMKTALLSLCSRGN